LSAVAVGGDGLIVEVHPDPGHAVSDGGPSLFPDQLETLVEEATAIAGVLGRTTARFAATGARRWPILRVRPRAPANRRSK
jgi:hypothetical protein